MSLRDTVAEILWTAFAYLIFLLGVLILLVMIPLEILYGQLVPTSRMKGDPNAGDD